MRIAVTLIAMKREVAIAAQSHMRWVFRGANVNRSDDKSLYVLNVCR